MKIKIATFNVENLFTRPRVFDLSEPDSVRVLEAITRLRDLLDDAVYDKASIAETAKKAHGFFTINKTRGENPLTYNRDTDTYRVNVEGPREWDGFIELTRKNFEFETVRNTGALIRKLKADILGLCEVEDAWTLRRFRTDQLPDAKLRYDLVIDGNDPRRIDVGLLSRFPLGCIHTYSHERGTGGGDLFSRDCLEVEIKLGLGQPLYILQNHFKSKLGRPEDSNRKRKAQAERVKKILTDRYDLQRDWVVVCGDLNDTPESDSLSPLLSMPGMTDVLTLFDQGPEGSWTYYYKRDDAKNQIDYLIASDGLRPFIRNAGVERRGIFGIEELTNGLIQPLPGVADFRTSASDHGAVWAEIDLPGPEA